jgi:hypothetical protein
LCEQERDKNKNRGVAWQGRIGSPNFGGIFFQRAPKKKGQKEQSKVQNSSANVLANKRKGNK